PRSQPADPELVVPDATPTKPARSARGRLRVNVIPWADVRVDGKPFGRAPVDRALPAGRHEVELYNPDIPRRAEHHVVIAADRPFEITHW
ncbi:MAG: PEGA domain-containing protein, partial [Deltaproteobacteria bacterium]|nr:PEGA domain-containing protein [Nannocystaceae bacterium]